MKFLKIILPVVLLFILSCNEAEKQEIARLTAENEELKTESNDKDSIMMFMLDALNEIEENLMEVRERQSAIDVRTSSGEKAGTSKERILNDISFINSLMDENNQKLSDLKIQLEKARDRQRNSTKQLSKSNGQLKQLESLIDKLQKQNSQKSLEIQALKDELVSMNFELEKVSMAYAKELQTSEEQKEELNTAYYIVNTYKALKKLKILNRKGSFIGIGGAKAMVEDFDKDLFTKIDIAKVNEITINSKKASMATVHPPGSYEFVEKDGKIEKLLISNPNEFWSVSKFLVLIKK